MRRTVFSSSRQRHEFESEALVHLDALYGLALRLTRNERDAEDLVQDALVKAFRFYDRFETGSNIKAWLFKILTNTFYNTFRKTKSVRRVELEAEVEGHYDRFISEATAAGEDAEAGILDGIAVERIKEAVEGLPEEFRLAVLLCDVYDFSYKEIAEILECPVGTVMSRLYRGRRLLQKALWHYAVERGIVPAPAESSGADAPTDLDAYRRRRGQ
ncbi:MAG: sigma-70 family RNA polymerase sigma factor [Deltaproteobacteria bacterium]|nr:sigma-70 family RNA polymerase sigma factor [Deltaproteobacteria bacterium]